MSFCPQTPQLTYKTKSAFGTLAPELITGLTIIHSQELIQFKGV